MASEGAATMQLTCPCCHARFPLEAMQHEDAVRELLQLMAGLEPSLARPLTSYLGCWRARKTQLGWDRALRLTREVLALSKLPRALEAALVETVTAMDEKRSQPSWKPLSSHNYLVRVLESTTGRLEASASLAIEQPSGGLPVARTKSGQAIVNLEAMRRDPH